MNRIERINRVRRLDRTLPTSRFPADVAAILALSPDVYFDLRFPALPGIGQILWQDSVRTTEVDTAGQTIGSALNLGSLGGYAESSGTQRPLWAEHDGGAFDGIDDELIAFLDTEIATQPLTWVVYCGISPSSVFRRVVASATTGTDSSFDSSPLLITSASQLGAVYGFLRVAGDLSFTADSIRAFTQVDGASSEIAISGDVSMSASGTLGPRVQRGVSLGSLHRLTAQYHLGPIRAAVMFDRILTAAEIAALPGAF